MCVYVYLTTCVLNSNLSKIQLVSDLPEHNHGATLAVSVCATTLVSPHCRPRLLHMNCKTRRTDCNIRCFDTKMEERININISSLNLTSKQRIKNKHSTPLHH